MAGSPYPPRGSQRNHHDVTPGPPPSCVDLHATSKVKIVREFVKNSPRDAAITFRRGFSSRDKGAHGELAGTTFAHGTQEKRHATRVVVKS
uniref:Uncharacterized protein n=1 Tax=Hyaloperonospora arabidopsidis (strain Emoy2) TaxID=559515 RepID=M4C098_HYAAE